MMDREQELQIKRARSYGYRWARDHEKELRACEGPDKATVWLAREMPLPCPMGGTAAERTLQEARILRAAMHGAFAFARHAGINIIWRKFLELLPY